MHCHCHFFSRIWQAWFSISREKSSEEKQPRTVSWLASAAAHHFAKCQECFNVQDWPGQINQDHALTSSPSLSPRYVSTTPCIHTHPLKRFTNFLTSLHEINLNSPHIAQSKFFSKPAGLYLVAIL